MSRTRRREKRPVRARSQVPMPPTVAHRDRSKYRRKTKHIRKEMAVD